MRFLALISLLAASSLAAPLLQPRDSLESRDGGKDLENAYKQMSKSYENAMKEYTKAAGKSNGDLTKAYSDYAKTVGQLTNDAREFLVNLNIEYAKLNRRRIKRRWRLF